MRVKVLRKEEGPLDEVIGGDPVSQTLSLTQSYSSSALIPFRQQNGKHYHTGRDQHRLARGNHAGAARRAHRAEGRYGLVHGAQR